MLLIILYVDTVKSDFASVIVVHMAMYTNSVFIFYFGSEKCSVFLWFFYTFILIL